jgi:hypothetical protein
MWHQHHVHITAGLLARLGGLDNQVANHLGRCSCRGQRRAGGPGRQAGPGEEIAPSGRPLRAQPASRPLAACLARPKPRSRSLVARPVTHLGATLGPVVPRHPGDRYRPAHLRSGSFESVFEPLRLLLLLLLPLNADDLLSFVSPVCQGVEDGGVDSRGVAATSATQGAERPEPSTRRIALSGSAASRRTSPAAGSPGCCADDGGCAPAATMSPARVPVVGRQTPGRRAACRRVIAIAA